MSSNLKLDSNWDIVIGRGATRVGGVDFVAQNVKSRLMTLLGEWQHNPSLGLPWFDGLLGKHVTSDDIQVAVQNVILSTNNVRYVALVTVDADHRQRTISINFTAESDFGTIEDSVTNVWQIPHTE